MRRVVAIVPDREHAQSTHCDTVQMVPLTNFRILFPLLWFDRRFLPADESTKQVVLQRRAGASIIVQGLSSFVVGAGLLALSTRYYIFEELRQGNQIMLTKQNDSESYHHDHET